MRDSSDMELVRDYVRLNSEAAFAELVQRHVALVYSVALRHVGIAAHAEEITQAVFIILARKAAGLRADTILEGWLHETTRLTALSFLRGERRRQFREQEVYMQSTLQENNDAATWNQLAPLLDEAVSRLGKKDRDAVMLRFFKDKNLREVAAALNVNEAAAQRRVHRAVEKLRGFFTKRGVALSSVAITGAISANSVQAAPVALAKSVTAVALAKGAAASGSTLTLIKGALKIMAWTKMKTAIVISACVLLTAGTTTITIYNAGKPMRNIQSEWSAISGNDAQWSWSGGRIEAHTVDGDSIFASSRKYGDVTFSAIASTFNGEASLAVRMQDGNNGYLAVFAPSGTVPNPDGFVRLVKRVSGEPEIRLATYQGKRLPAPGKPFKIQVVAKGSLIEVFLNGANILRARDTTFTNGFIGFRVYGWGDYPCDSTFSGVSFY
jgi:RNA polymerase sigma factor (sigma-70 family)